MRISLLLPGLGPLADSLKMARLAEACGLDGVWAAEHVGFHDATVPAALYLEQTKNLEIGLMGIGAGTRHPALAAMELGSLSEAFPGRVRAQVGTGEQALMARVGISFSQAVTRVGAMLETVRGGLSHQPVTAETPIGSLDGFQLFTSSPPVPIDVLAIRPRMLGLAAELGDGVCLTGGASQQYVQTTTDFVRGLRREHGLDPDAFRVTAVVFALIAPDWEAHLGTLASVFAGFSPSTAGIILRGALNDESLAELESRHTPEERLSLFTPEVVRRAAILTDHEGLHKSLSEWASLGIDEICVLPMGPDDLRAPSIEALGAAKQLLIPNNAPN